jgi:uncharacterized protein YndB with AHSA1/START domain
MEKGSDNHGQPVSLTRIFPASPEVVFEAWTNPEHMKGWWKFGEGWITDVASVDLRKGGEFRIGASHVKTGETLVVRGVYHEVVPAKRLTFSFILEGGIATENEELVTVQFEDFHGDTRMELTHSNLKKDESRILREKGWEAMLGNLAILLLSGRSRPQA